MRPIKRISLKTIRELFISKFLIIFSYIYGIKKGYRKLILFTIDFLLILLSINIVTYFLYPVNNAIVNITSINYKYDGILSNNWLILILILVIFVVFNLTGQYISLSGYIKSNAIYGIAFRTFLVVSIFLFVKLILNFTIFDLRQFILLWIISTLLITLFRFGIKEINISLSSYKSQKIRHVAIYGAGAAGAQLASSLILTGNNKIIAFFDDSANLNGRKLLGIPIFPSEEIGKYKNQIDQILLAIPSLSKDGSKLILNKIQDYQIPVFKVPSIEELTSGKARIDSLKPIEVEDLLGRGSVMPNKELIKESINGLNICITGAGGSIGKELCLQIIKYSPNSLIMIDNCESNLYHLEQEINSNYLNDKNINLKFILGNVKNYNFMKNILIKNAVDNIFHAAAYKHVPLIELNPIQGIDNNVFATYTLCQVALLANIKKIILISTDKAVRPTNIMGASKRLAELIFQAYASKYNPKGNEEIFKKQYPKFSIVRFGNVLNSSGSVVPLFKKQIAKGGPITLTNEKVVRYFMTLPEAAQLVIQATTLSNGGEVFLLDMGSPVKIYDLAKQMIKLSGLKIKDLNNMDGDIQIITTGLRPGEKLYEELLINAESKPTEHPLIFKANENYIPYRDLVKDISNLEICIEEENIDRIFKILSRMVPEWTMKKVNN